MCNMIKNGIKWMLSTYALVPCIFLFIVSLFLMAGAAIQADDFDREMTEVELMLFKSPVIPLVWFIAIVMARVFKVKQPISIGVAKRNTMWLTLGLIIPASILILFVL